MQIYEIIARNCVIKNSICLNRAELLNIVNERQNPKSNVDVYVCVCVFACNYVVHFYYVSGGVHCGSGWLLSGHLPFISRY